MRHPVSPAPIIAVNNAILPRVCGRNTEFYPQPPPSGSRFDR